MNKRLNYLINEYFTGLARIEVTTDDIDCFMKQINSEILDMSHEKIEEYTYSGHLDRISLKDSLRLYLLQQLAARYPQQTIEFMWRLENKK